MTLSPGFVRDMVMLVMLIRSPVLAHMNCEDIFTVVVMSLSQSARTGRYCADRSVDFLTCTITESSAMYALVVSVIACLLEEHSELSSQDVHFAIWLSSTIKPPPGLGKIQHFGAAPCSPFIALAYLRPTLRASVRAASRSVSLANMYTMNFIS